MKKIIFIYFICIFFIIILQSTILDYIIVCNIKPNLLIVFIISVALLRGNIEGAVVGFFIGLSQDIVSGKMIGFYALMGMYLGMIIGSVNKRLYRENYFVIVFFTFIASVAYEFAVYFFSIYIKSKTDLLFPLKSIILPESLYNCVISIFVYILIIKLNRSFENSNKISRKYL